MSNQNTSHLALGGCTVKACWQARIAIVQRCRESRANMHYMAVQRAPPCQPATLSVLHEAWAEPMPHIDSKASQYLSRLFVERPCIVDPCCLDPSLSFTSVLCTVELVSSDASAKVLLPSADAHAGRQPNALPPDGSIGVVACTGDEFEGAFAKWLAKTGDAVGRPPTKPCCPKLAGDRQPPIGTLQCNILPEL